MRYAICLGLLLGTIAFAQQQGGPPMGTPPTLPDHPNPERRMPPDTAAPAPAGAPTSGEVQQEINKKLSEEPRLNTTKVRFDVDDRSVIVGGTVQSEEQHTLALKLAQSYAGDRKVVDFVKVQPTR